MAVKVRRYGEMLEKETQKSQTLTKANLKAAVKAGGFGKEADKYDRPSLMDKTILYLLRRKKGATK